MENRKEYFKERSKEINIITKIESFFILLTGISNFIWILTFFFAGIFLNYTTGICFLIIIGSTLGTIVWCCLIYLFCEFLIDIKAIRVNIWKLDKEDKLKDNEE